jgi:hypothetical protein
MAAKKSPRKKTATRSRPRRRPPTATPVPPAAPLAVPTPEPVAIVKLRYRVDLADCVTVTVTNCESVTVSDQGAYVHIEGDGHSG